MGGEKINQLNVKLAINAHVHTFSTEEKEERIKTINDTIYGHTYPILKTDGPFGERDSIEKDRFPLIILKKEGNRLFIDRHVMNNRTFQVFSKRYEVVNSSIIELP